jgi:hypothetical protein
MADWQNAPVVSGPQSSGPPKWKQGKLVTAPEFLRQLNAPSDGGGNVFDQFDQVPPPPPGYTLDKPKWQQAPIVSAPTGGNVFDQFDGQAAQSGNQPAWKSAPITGVQPKWMQGTPVTDPALLQQLNSGAPGTPVTDPSVLAQLNTPAAAPSMSPLTQAMLPLRDEQGNINIMPELHREMNNLRTLQDKFTPDNLVGDVMGAGNAVGNWLLEAMLGGGNAMSKGIRDMGVGLASLPTDIGSAVGLDDVYPSVGLPSPSDISQSISDAVPNINTDSTAQNIAAAITQYGAPAGAGAKLVGMLPKVAELSPLAQWGLRLLGAGAGDAAVTDPENASTIGNLAPTIAPTAIEEDDSPLMKRFKVGVETIPVGGAIDLGLKGVGKAVDTAAPALMNMTAEGRRFSVGKQFADAGVPENVATEAKNLEAGDFKPIVSDVVNTPQTQGIARDLLNKPEGAALVNRVKENEAAASQNFNEALAPTKASKNALGLPEGAATNEFQRQKTGKLAVPDQAVANIESAQAGVNARNAANQAQIAANAGTRQDASATLSDLIEQERQSATDVKNGLYARATQLGRDVPVDPQGLADIAGAVRSDIGPLAQQDASLNAILGDLDRLAPEEDVATGILDAAGNPIARPAEGQAVTLADLIDLRPRLSRAIDSAAGKYRGDVVQRLTDLRRAIDEQINGLAEGDGPAVDALRAAEANFRENFAPKFREGQGGVIDKGAKTGNPVQPTATADVFLKSNSAKGAREATEDLNRIFAESENRGAARTAARDYMVGLMADKLGQNVTGPRIEQFIATYGEAIDGVPGLRQDMQQMANRLNVGSGQTAQLDEALKAAQDARKGAEKGFDESPAGLWLKGDVDTAINAAMGNAQKMRQLVTAARKDGTGAALTDVKNRIKAKINDAIRNDGSQISGGSAKPGTNTGKALENKDVVVSLAKANNLLKEGTPEREALKAIFSPAEMKNLDLYRKQLELATRNTGMKGTKGSDTTLNIMSGIQSGSGVVQGDLRAGMFTRLLKFLDQHSLNTAGKRNELMIKALTDPELAGTLVIKYNAENARVVERRLNQYLSGYTVNNVLSVDTSEQQKAGGY